MLALTLPIVPNCCASGSMLDQAEIDHAKVEIAAVLAEDTNLTLLLVDDRESMPQRHGGAVGQLELDVFIDPKVTRAEAFLGYLTHATREAFCQQFGKSSADLDHVLLSQLT